jgi:N-acetyl-anhydromuramyl-L-alanine amidase AmpD
MKINKVTIHITASSNDATPEQIREEHLNKGWSDCGYHFLVDREGVIHPMRPESLTGAHVAGHNLGNIGISYISRGSDTEADGTFGKYMTEKQKEGLILITAQMCKKYKLRISNIWGHNDFDGVAKACPCFKVKKAEEFLNAVKELIDNLPENVFLTEPPEQMESVDGNEGCCDGLARGATRSK